MSFLLIRITQFFKNLPQIVKGECDTKFIVRQEKIQNISGAKIPRFGEIRPELNDSFGQPDFLVRVVSRKLDGDAEGELQLAAVHRASPLGPRCCRRQVVEVVSDQKMMPLIRRFAGRAFMMF
jgi:hypothetical protein